MIAKPIFIGSLCSAQVTDCRINYKIVRKSFAKGMSLWIAFYDVFATNYERWING